MTKRTKADEFKRIAYFMHHDPLLRVPMPRADGSIMTKPVVPCPPLPESEVSDLVKEWLTRHGCEVDRLNNAAGKLVHADGSVSEYQTFGIKGGGDFSGSLPNGIRLEVECKKGTGGVLKKSQQKRMRKAKRCKWVYIVVHGIPELEHKLCPILEKL